MEEEAGGEGGREGGEEVEGGGVKGGRGRGGEGGARVAGAFEKEQRKESVYFVAADWTGGIYATPSLAGSRSGAIIA
eukprot:182352-Hanusia_phi.AAC.1